MSHTIALSVFTLGYRSGANIQFYSLMKPERQHEEEPKAGSFRVVFLCFEPENETIYIHTCVCEMKICFSHCFYGVNNHLEWGRPQRDTLLAVPRPSGAISSFLFVRDHRMLQFVLLACSFDVREEGCNAAVIPEGHKKIFWGEATSGRRGVVADRITEKENDRLPVPIPGWQPVICLFCFHFLFPRFDLIFFFFPVHLCSPPQRLHPPLVFSPSPPLAV